MSNTNIISLDQDHVYLNIQVQNQDYKDSQTASITKTFREPILNRPSEWYVSLIKAEIPATYIPLFDFATYCTPAEIAPNPSPPNPQAELVYTFTYLGVDYTSKLVYPSGFAAPINIAQKRYPVYNIDQFLGMCNTALRTAYLALPAGIRATLQGPPIMVYDPTIRLFGIQCPNGYVTNPSNPAYTGVQIWMNDALYAMFDTLPYKNYDNTNGSNGYKNNQLHVDIVYTTLSSNIINRTTTTSFLSPQLGAPPVSPTDGIVYYSMLQEINSIANLYSIQNIIFTSNLPTIPEYINSVTSGSNGLNSQESIIQFPILSEISPIPGDVEQRILYIPSADFRLRNMSSNDPITNIQIQVFWQDKSGLIQPIRIPPRESLSLKLLFRRKTYQNSFLYELNSLPEDDKKKVIRSNFSSQY